MVTGVQTCALPIYNLAEVVKTDPKHVCGVKLFMGSSTGNMLVDKNEVLVRLFRESPCLIAAHCEDEDIIQWETISPI